MANKIRHELDDIVNGDETKKDDGILSYLTDKFAKSFEGLDFTSKMKKANELIPFVKMIPGGEAFLKDQAYKVASLGAAPIRTKEELAGDKSGSYTGSDKQNRDLIKLAIYGDESGFEKVPKDILEKATIPLSSKELTDKYSNIESYYTPMKYRGEFNDKDINQVTDSVSYDSMMETVKSLLNRNLRKKGLDMYNDSQLTHKADSVLNSITPTNSVIYSSRSRDPLRSPYRVLDNLAGYTARIRRDDKTNSLWYDVNDVWDFDSGYADRWGKDKVQKEAAENQSKALEAVTKPFRLIATNPVAKPKKKYENGGNINMVPNQKLNYNYGGNMYFLGGLTGATAVSGGGEAAGQLAGMINPNTKGGGAASGAFKGASMGSALGPYGMAAGALIGGVAGFVGAENAQNKQAFSDSINSMKERNNMLGIKANGGYILPLGVNPNQSDIYEGGGELTEFNNGGTHSQNPYQGIPQGVDQDGQQNKVEQGETKYKDYIFSNQLILDKNTVTEHNLPKSLEGKSFADASKKLSKLIKERPNDPISKATHKDYMKSLMMANDKTRQIEESNVMAMGGRLYGGGAPLLIGNKLVDVNKPENNETLALRMGDTFLNPSSKLLSTQKLNTGLETGKLQSKIDSTKGIDGTTELPFFRDSKNLRYAPIAFDALAGAGLFGKSPSPEQYSPTLIQQQGSLIPGQIDEMQMRNAVDSAYQTGSSGLAEASGGSGASLRAGLTGLSNDYMSSIGKSYADANKSNINTRMTADQFNLGMNANIAAQNAQFANQADMYNNQMANQSKTKRYEDSLSYLAKGAEGLGDIGYEQRMREIMPRIYGYDDYGRYVAPLNKKCGGRLRLKNHKK